MRQETDVTPKFNTKIRKRSEFHAIRLPFWIVLRVHEFGNNEEVGTFLRPHFECRKGSSALANRNMENHLQNILEPVFKDSHEVN